MTERNGIRTLGPVAAAENPRFPGIQHCCDIPLRWRERDSNPRSPPTVSSVHPGARDATHAAIVNPGMPIVRVDELGERFAACPGGAFHMDKAGPELEIGFGDF